MAKCIGLVCIFIITILAPAVLSQTKCGCPGAVTKRAALNKTMDIDENGEPFILVGDMRLKPEDINVHEGNKFRSAESKNKRWPNGQLDYYFDGTHSSEEQSTIKTALQRLSDMTGNCIKFKQHSRAPRGVKHVVVKKKGGCYSDVGRSTSTRYSSQTLSLGDGCLSERTIMHEFTHALGFYHEQERPDRRRTIKINWNNIMSGTGCYNYEMCKGCETSYAPFDLNSMMMYWSFAFSCNKKPTMTDLSGNIIKRAIKASEYDIQKIMNYYQCKTQPNKKLINEMRDFDGTCPRQAKRGLCKTNDYYRENCELSCYREAKGTNPGVSTKPKPPPAVTKPKPKKKCKKKTGSTKTKPTTNTLKPDRYRGCKSYAKAGKCSKPKYKNEWCVTSCANL